MPPSRHSKRPVPLGTVRLRCPAVPPAEYGHGRSGVPLWRVYLTIAARGIETTGGGIATGGKVNEPLDILVTCPDWATGVNGGWFDGVVKIAAGRWNHATLVGPLQHDPDNGRVGSDRPRVRFDDPDLTVLTVPPGQRNERDTDRPCEQMYRAERACSPVGRIVD